MKKIEFDYSYLRGLIRQKFGTEENFSVAIGMSRTTLSQRLNNLSEFDQTEMLACTKALDFEADLIPLYFFTLKVQKTEQITP